MPKKVWRSPNANDIELDFSRPFSVEFLSVTSGMCYHCIFSGGCVNITTYSDTRPVSTMMPINPKGFQKLFNLLAKKDSIEFSFSRYGNIRKRESLPTITTKRRK